MPRARVLRTGGLKLDGNTHDEGAVIDIADHQVYKNLVNSRKVAPHDIDSKLAQAPATLSEKIDQDRAAAENVISGATGATTKEPANKPAEGETSGAGKVLTAKSAKAKPSKPATKKKK